MTIDELLIIRNETLGTPSDLGVGVFLFEATRRAES